MPRAAVRAVSGVAGGQPPTTKIKLTIDNSSPIHVGGAISGRVKLIGRYPIHTAQVVLEIMEYSVVVVTPNGQQKHQGLGHVQPISQKNVVLSKEVTLNQDSPPVFSFSLEENLPASFRWVLDGTHPTMPSQCQIKYVVTASIFRNGSTSAVSQQVVVLPKQESNVPLDPNLSVSIGSSWDLISQYFSCGNIELVHDENNPNGGNNQSSSSLPKKHLLLRCSRKKLHLSAGQYLPISFQEWLNRILSQHGLWMVKLTETVQWQAYGRIAQSRQTWDLYANHHELPTNMRQSYNDPAFNNPYNGDVVPLNAINQKLSLIQVTHELSVYFSSKGLERKVLASTPPIPVQIVSGKRGWAA